MAMRLRSLWATRDGGFGQVGCVYTAQGFGVRLVWRDPRPDLVWRGDRLVSDVRESRDPAFRGKNAGDFDSFVRNVYKVLLTRGMVGTVLYSTDPQTRKLLRGLVDGMSGRVGYKVNMSIESLTADLRAFAIERDWEQFHTPKNLAMALVSETGELLAEFQWLTTEQSEKLDEKQREAVAEEMADVLIYLCRLSDVLGIDLEQAAANKIAANAERYSIEVSTGMPRRFTRNSALASVGRIRIAAPARLRP